jgi:hypothetical protein
MSASPPLRLLLAAGPGAPGEAAWWARVDAEARRGRPLVVLLTGAGLAWLEAPRLAGLVGRHDVALCSRSARERGVLPEAVPPGVRWSSLVAWWRDADAGDAGCWALVP